MDTEIVVRKFPSEKLSPFKACLQSSKGANPLLYWLVGVKPLVRKRVVVHRDLVIGSSPCFLVLL